MEKIRPISLFIAIFIIALVISYHIYYHFIDEINDKVVNNYIENEIVEEISTNNVEKINIPEKKEKILGIIEISKINLKKGFYNINSKENNVNKNITILKGSEMPNIKGSTLILAAHSGDSYLSYFKDIDLLKLDDKIIIHYNNIKYNYLVNDIYELPKNGKITFNKNINENILVLTTCSKNKDKQLIVVSKLSSTN